VQVAGRRRGKSDARFHKIISATDEHRLKFWHGTL
jgi:hypothetical protein